MDSNAGVIIVKECNEYNMDEWTIVAIFPIKPPGEKLKDESTNDGRGIFGIKPLFMKE